MPARVTLIVREGDLGQKEYVFEDRASLLIGRDGDCSPRVPNNADYKYISRLHCLLDINPPDVSIRDYGSLNGTHLNGQIIDRRADDSARGIPCPERDLGHGDVITLGSLKKGKKVTFEVQVYTPAVCGTCSEEIPEDRRASSERRPGVFQCDACLAREQTQDDPALAARRGRVCVRCGKDVSGEVGEQRQGDYVCAACQADPLAIMRRLLEMARSGEKDLLAIEGYTVERELGKGGMGAVYLARHDRTGQRVALKVMLPKVAASASAHQRFLREAELTQALRHPHVVQLHETGCSRGTFFFTLEYCDGGSVDQRMKRRGTLPIAEAGAIILQVLQGLEYAHSARLEHRHSDGTVSQANGLVHRDLKPQNIFLCGPDSGLVAKVADYGLAKAFDMAGLSGQTRTGALAGTPVFMPRQQVVSFKYSKPEVDVWAAAASLYFMLTGRSPRDFPKGRDPWQVVLQTPAVPIRQRSQAIPEKLAEVIDHALVDKPSIGFRSAAELRGALESVL